MTTQLAISCPPETTAPSQEPFWAHQNESLAFLEKNERVLDASDPGTGKTRVELEDFRRRRRQGGGKALILGTKSILRNAWGNDIEHFTPDLRYIIASASNRLRAFKTEADVYITNHDAAVFLAAHPELLEGFDTLIIDELTAYKHASSHRSKAIRKLKALFRYRRGLTGTINSNTITDIWHQILLLDDGARLGTSFYKFRAAVCEPSQRGPSPDMLAWTDRPGAEEAVASLIADMTIRHEFDKCISIPPNHVRTIEVDLTPKHLELYNALKKDALLTLEEGEINAVHAGSLANKLLQAASGAVYSEDGKYILLDPARYMLVLDLVMERQHSLVMFNWKHQKLELCALAERAGISFAVIDGAVKDDERHEIVTNFQAGRYRVLFAHPQTAAHGLTLTRGTATIWASPTYNAEHFKQANKRIDRAGQTQSTETILIAARDTLEPLVYAKLQGKIDRMTNLLGLLTP